MDDVTFQDVVIACEYMGADDATRHAWQYGPTLGAILVAYVNAHKNHALALESGDTDKIDAAWQEYCKYQNAWTIAYATGV
jgi:hypothetical protein